MCIASSMPKMPAAPPPPPPAPPEPLDTAKLAGKPEDFFTDRLAKSRLGMTQLRIKRVNTLT